MRRGKEASKVNHHHLPIRYRGPFEKPLVKKPLSPRPFSAPSRAAFQEKPYGHSCNAMARERANNAASVLSLVAKGIQHQDDGQQQQHLFIPWKPCDTDGTASMQEGTRNCGIGFTRQCNRETLNSNSTPSSSIAIFV